MTTEAIKLTEQELHDFRLSDKRFQFNGITYRVGKMSYGQYFLEPGKCGGERSDFNKGTIWLVKDKQNYFVAD